MTNIPKSEALPINKPKDDERLDELPEEEARHGEARVEEVLPEEGQYDEALPEESPVEESLTEEVQTETERLVESRLEDAQHFEERSEELQSAHADWGLEQGAESQKSSKTSLTEPKSDSILDTDLTENDDVQDGDEGFTFQEEVNEALRRTRGRLPEPCASEISHLSEEWFEKEITEALARLESDKSLVIRGEAYVRDFANLIVNNLSQGRTVVRRIESHQRLLRSREHIVEIERMITSDCLHGQIIDLTISLPSNEDFASGLWRDGGFERLKDAVVACGATLIVAVEQVRRAPLSEMVELLNAVGVIIVPWLRIQLLLWQLQLDLNEVEIDEVEQEIQRRIQRAPNQEWRIASDLQRLQIYLEGVSGGQTYLLERIKELLSGNKRAEESSLTKLIDSGWQRRLCRVLLGLYTVLSETADGASYRSVRDLGQRIFTGIMILAPVEIEEIVEERRDGETVSTLSRRFEDIDAANAWVDGFDGLLRKCGLHTVRTELGLIIRSDIFLWDDHWLREEFSGRYPGAVEDIINCVRGKALLFPQDGNDFSVASSAARLLVGACRKEPSSYPIDVYTHQILDDASQRVMICTTAKKQELIAVGLALYLREVWGSNDGLKDEETRKILEELTRERLFDAIRVKVLVHAFAILTQDKGFPAEQYLFDILERIGTSANTEILKVWSIVRLGFINQMRRSHEDRLQILLELQDQEQASRHRIWSRSIMSARLWYDGIRADFVRSDLLFEQTFAQALLESEDTISKIVTPLWASDPDMIAVSLPEAAVRRDIARMLLDGVDPAIFDAPSLTIEKLLNKLRDVIGQRHDTEVVAALERVYDAVESTRQKKGPLAAWMHIHQLSETQEHSDLRVRVLLTYHQYRSIALFAWITRAEEEAERKGGDSNALLERFFQALNNSISLEARRSIGKDWVTAGRWLDNFENSLSNLETATVEVKEKYKHLKHFLHERRKHLRELARACREDTN